MTTHIMDLITAIVFSIFATLTVLVALSGGFKVEEKTSGVATTISLAMAALIVYAAVRLLQL